MVGFVFYIRALEYYQHWHCLKHSKFSISWLYGLSNIFLHLVNIVLPLLFHSEHFFDYPFYSLVSQFQINTRTQCETNILQVEYQVKFVVCYDDHPLLWKAFVNISNSLPGQLMMQLSDGGGRRARESLKLSNWKENSFSPKSN